MEDARRDAQLDELLAELAWLKRLAAALVRDESDADDIVQETWLVAAERAPKDGRPLKPWLSRVALNLVRMRSRGAKRRGARESAAESLAQAQATPDELVSRVEAQRIVVDEVLRLAEPYRTTILLFYFEDLPTAEIARRLGIPEGTVRRRLKVARDELRGRLRAEERSTGRGVLAALAPLAAKQGAASVGGKALGAIAVKKVVAIVVVVVGLLLVGARLYRRHADPSEPVAATGGQPGAGAARSRAVPGGGASLAHVVVAVADAAGPLAGAMVRCAPTDGDVVVVKAARDGNASVDLAPGEWEIAASAEGHEPAATTLAVVAGGDDRVRVVLATGGRTLTGVVTDATGGTIPGARIDAAQLGLDATAGRGVAVAFSDTAGRYALSVGAGEILVAASHPEYAPQTRYVGLGSSGATADFALVPGGVIEGVVRDLQTKQPVANAVVRARAESSALDLAELNERVVTADAAGAFRFAGLRPGVYALVAREGARSTRAPVAVGLGVAEQQSGLVLLVGTAAAIRGTVVDESGAAASGVTVRAFGDRGEGGAATSDATGAFVLDGLAPSRWALRGTSDRYISDGQAIAELKKSDVGGVVVRVRHGIEVTGHVEPRESCDVAITTQERDAPATRHDAMTTTADGAFHFAPFGAGTATLVARCPNGDQGTGSVALGADAGEQVVPVAPGASIGGRVADAAGTPIAGVAVTAESVTETTRVENGVVASGFTAITSTGGGFEIRGLAAAGYRLAAFQDGRPMKATAGTRIPLAAGQHATGIELVVERPAGTIRGTVTGPDGAPIPDAWVSVYQTFEDQGDALRAGDPDNSRTVYVRGGGTGGELPPALTDARGHFALTSLPRGRYQMIAEARGGKLRGRAADVTPDAQIAIRLDGVGALRGTVRGPRGPSELFSVQLAGPTSDARSFTDGAFEFPRLDPGDYTLAVTSNDGTASATARVASDEPASVDIELVANVIVTGRLVDAAGKPLSGKPVALIPDQPPDQLRIELHEQPPTSGPDGRFQVAGQPGMRTLVILGRRPTVKRGISLAAGKTVDLGDVTVDEAP